MVYPTNIVALVESDFLVKTRDMMKDREQAFNLYEWAIKCLRTGENKEFV
ncbi:hypothetical protein ACYHXO_004614, partial [Salmonella enterica subsp. enterica serovar Eko]